MQYLGAEFWQVKKPLDILVVCLFVISQQPYAAVFVFAFLIIKALMLIKWQ
jgi:hypothetical protein